MVSTRGPHSFFGQTHPLSTPLDTPKCQVLCCRYIIKLRDTHAAAFFAAYDKRGGAGTPKCVPSGLCALPSLGRAACSLNPCHWALAGGGPGPNILFSIHQPPSIEEVFSQLQ